MLLGTVADSPLPPPPIMSVEPPPPSSIPDVPRAVRRLLLGSDESCGERSASPSDECHASPFGDESCGGRSASPSSGRRLASPARGESSDECHPSPLCHDWSPYPTPPAAPRKDQYIPESEGSDVEYERQRRPPPPAKIFRYGQLMFHRTYKGPEPIGYVDTGLYEGGNHDWYEAYTDVDLRWARRLDLVLQRHRIERWHPAAGQAQLRDEVRDASLRRRTA